MKNSYIIILLLTFFIIGCQSIDTMDLLDEEIAEINVSLSNGTGQMNEDIVVSIKDKDSINQFREAIITAEKQTTAEQDGKPHYDIMVEYKSDEGKLPTHAIHLWLGEENEPSRMMYMIDNSIYQTSPKKTKELRKILLKED